MFLQQIILLLQKGPALLAACDKPASSERSFQLDYCLYTSCVPKFLGRIFGLLKGHNSEFCWPCENWLWGRIHTVIKISVTLRLSVSRHVFVTNICAVF